MKSTINDPVFKKLLETALTKHQENIILGTIMREKFLNPRESFPGIPTNDLIKILIATCFTKREIKKLFKKLKFNIISLSVMEEPIDDKGKEILAFNQIIGNNPLTNNVLPCYIVVKL